MNRERTIGVRETGLGLSLLTCALLVFGYLALHRFGGAGPEPPVEIRPESSIDPDATAAGRDKSDAPRILPAQGADEPNAPAARISQRPVWLPPLSVDGRENFDADSDSFWPSLPSGIGDVSPTGRQEPH